MFEKPHFENNKENKQEVFEKVFNSKNWQEFQRLPKIIGSIKKYESAEELNNELKYLMIKKEYKGGESPVIINCTGRTEQELNESGNLPEGINVFYESRDKQGGGDGYLIENNVAYLFDTEGHGKDRSSIKTLVREALKKLGDDKTISEEEYYEKLQEFLLNIREVTNLDLGLSASISTARLIKDKTGQKSIEMSNGCGEAFAIIRNDATGEVYTNTIGGEWRKIEEKKIEAEKRLPMPNFKIGFFSVPLPNQKENISKVLALENQPHSLIMLTDGYETGQPAYLLKEGKIWANEIEEGISYFDRDFIQFCQENRHLNDGDAFYQKLQKIMAENIKRAKDNKEDSVDDFTMVRLSVK